MKTFALDDRFSLNHEINFIAKIAAREDALSGLKVLPMDGLIIK